MKSEQVRLINALSDAVRFENLPLLTLKLQYLFTAFFQLKAILAKPVADKTLAKNYSDTIALINKFVPKDIPFQIPPKIAPQTPPAFAKEEVRAVPKQPAKSGLTMMLSRGQ